MPTPIRSRAPRRLALSRRTGVDGATAGSRRSSRRVPPHRIHSARRHIVIAQLGPEPVPRPERGGQAGLERCHLRPCVEPTVARSLQNVGGVPKPWDATREQPLTVTLFVAVDVHEWCDHPPTTGLLLRSAVRCPCRSRAIDLIDDLTADHVDGPVEALKRIR